jgi:hypothetical protein
MRLNTTALYRASIDDRSATPMIAPAPSHRGVAPVRPHVERRSASCARSRGDAAHKRYVRGCRGLIRTSQEMWTTAPQLVAATLVLGRAASAAVLTSFPVQSSSSAMPWWIAPLAVGAGIAGVGVQLLLTYLWIVAKGSMH